MLKMKLRASVAATALFCTVGFAWANSSQYILNWESIAVSSSQLSLTSLGTGATGSIGATGASASVSASVVNSGVPLLVAFGTVTQSAISYGSVTTTNGQSVISTSVGLGGSASISSIGSVSSLSFNGISDSSASRLTLDSSPSLAGVTQSSGLSLGSISNTNATVTVLGTGLGAGASASISSIGTLSQVSAAAIGSVDGLAFTPTSILQTNGSAGLMTGGPLPIEVMKL